MYNNTQQGATPMGQINSTKKMILTAALTSALALTGLQSALAAPGDMKDPGAMKGAGAQMPCPMQNQMMGMQGGPQMNEEMMKARDAFLSETTELRKNLAEKQAARRALMMGTNPDPEKAAVIAGELFDLREQLRIKAQAAGLPAGMMQRMTQGMGGCGQMAGNRHDMGMMGGNAMKGGMHHRR